MIGFTFLALLFMYSTFFSSNTSPVVGWITLGVSVLLGIIVGLILAKISRIGVAVLAGWGGVCLALILWSAVLYKVNSQVVFWIVIVVFAGVCAVVSFFVYDHALIISTAIIGAYGFVRGISLFAGHYPNEFTIISLIEKGLFKNIDPIFYAYLAGMIVVAVIGLIVQYKMKSKEEDAKRHPYYNMRMN